MKQLESNKAKRAEAKQSKWHHCVSLVTKELKEAKRADDYEYELIPVLTNRSY